MKKILFFITLILFFLKPLPAFAAEGCRVFDDTGDGSECAGTEYPSACPGPTSYCCVDAQACDDHYINQYETITSWYNPSKQDYDANLTAGGEADINSTRFTSHNLSNIAYWFSDNAIITNQGLAKGMTTMYAYKPAHVGTYLADLGQRAKIVPPAYAQGLGFSALTPVLDIWKASRNFAYLGFTLMFIITGILIMIRQKIDPQTVISLQQALPRLVITLLLITFSYAIAGFVIDIMYILINLSIQLFKTFGLYDSVGNFQNEVLGQSILGTMLREIFGSINSDATEAISRVVDDVFGDSQWATLGLGQLLSHTIGYVIIAFMLLYAGFKTFIILLMSYVKLIIGVIVGPIQIMFNALPGSDSFKKWLMGLLSNIAPFVIVVIMLLLAGVFVGKTAWGAKEGIGFYNSSATTFDSWKVPLINISNMESFIAIFALGILMLMPSAAQMAQDFFKVEAFKYGTALGEAGKFGWGRTSGIGTEAFEQYQLKEAGAEKETQLRRELQLYHKRMGTPDANANAHIERQIRKLRKQSRLDRGLSILGRIGKG